MFVTVIVLILLLLLTLCSASLPILFGVCHLEKCVLNCTQINIVVLVHFNFIL